MFICLSSLCITFVIISKLLFTYIYIYIYIYNTHQFKKQAPAPQRCARGVCASPSRRLNSHFSARAGLTVSLTRYHWEVMKNNGISLRRSRYSSPHLAPSTASRQLMHVHTCGSPYSHAPVTYLFRDACQEGSDDGKIGVHPFNSRRRGTYLEHISSAKFGYNVPVIASVK